MKDVFFVAGYDGVSRSSGNISGQLEGDVDMTASCFAKTGQIQTKLHLTIDLAISVNARKGKSR